MCGPWAGWPLLHVALLHATLYLSMLERIMEVPTSWCVWLQQPSLILCEAVLHRPVCMSKTSQQSSNTHLQPLAQTSLVPYQMKSFAM